jgi:hypothetical protein
VSHDAIGLRVLLDNGAPRVEARPLIHREIKVNDRIMPINAYNRSFRQDRTVKGLQPVFFA